MRSGCSTTAPSDSSPESSCIIISESGGKEMQQVRHYTGAFSHPCFGPDEIPIEVALYSSSEGQWKAVDQVEQITVQRDGKSVVMTDSIGATTLDGQEVVGGILIGVVIQHGEPGGRFRLRPCSKQRVHRATLLKRTCIQRHVTQIPVVTRQWRAVGVPAKMAMQSAGEMGWRTTYQMAFS